MSASATKTLVVRYLGENGLMTVIELAALVGVIPRNIQRALSSLSAPAPAERLAHVGAWCTVNRGKYGPIQVAQWVAGPGRHARKPAAMTGAEQKRTSRERLQSVDRVFAAGMRAGAK